MRTEPINEKDILAFLKDREQLITEELRKVRAIIKVIESSSSVLSNDGEGNYAGAFRSSEPSKKVRKPLQRMDEYLKDGYLDEKISYALTQLGTGYKEDILEILVEKEPESNLVNLQNALGVRLSYLLKNDVIQGEKHGRKYQYTLK